jgi:hypothetical protein
MAEDIDLSRGQSFTLHALLQFVLSSSVLCQNRALTLLMDDCLEASDHSGMLLGFRRPAELWTSPLNVGATTSSCYLIKDAKTF